MPTIEEMKAFEATVVDYDARCNVLQELLEEEMMQNALDEALTY